MIAGPAGRRLPDHLAFPAPIQPLPETIALHGPGYPDRDTGPCYACGATSDEPCVPGCEALRLSRL